MHTKNTPTHDTYIRLSEHGAHVWGKTGVLKINFRIATITNALDRSNYTYCTLHVRTYISLVTSNICTMPEPAINIQWRCHANPANHA